MFKRVVIILLNLMLITAAVLSVVIYSKHVRRQQEETTLNAFISAVESMKGISENYLQTEKVFADNWAKYIEKNDLDLDGALEYIRSSNTHRIVLPILLTWTRLRLTRLIPKRATIPFPVTTK